MNLRNSLKDLVKQDYPILELGYVRGDTNETYKTCTVERVNSSGWLGILTPNPDNYLYGVKYSPTNTSSTITPAKDFVIIGYTNKNDAYILLTSAVTAQFTENVDGTKVAKTEIDNNGVLITTIKEKGTLINTKTADGDINTIIGDKSFHIRASAGSILNVGDNINIMAGENKKICIAVQKSNIINNKSTILLFTKSDPNNPNIRKVAKDQYYYGINLLKWLNELQSDPVLLASKTKGFSANGLIDYQLQVKLLEAKLLEVQNLFADSILDDVFDKIIRSVKKLHKFDYIDYALFTVGVYTFIIHTIRTDGFSIVDPGTIVQRPDIDIYNNFLKFEKMCTTTIVVGSKFNISRFNEFLINNNVYVGYYFYIILAIIGLFNIDTNITPQSNVNAAFNYINTYKARFADDESNQSLEMQEAQEEIENVVNNIDGIETVISLKDIMTQQNDIIIRQNEMILDILNSVNTLVSAGVTVAGTSGVMTGLSTFASDVITFTTDLNEIKTDIEKVTSEGIEVLLQ